MSDPFERFSAGLESPASDVVPVSKADADLPDGTCRALLLSAAASLNIMTAAGNIRTNVALQAGYNPIRVKQVRTGGDTVDVWALY